MPALENDLTAQPTLIQRQLLAAREKLISTDARNPLIHFRRPAKSLVLTEPPLTVLAGRLLTEHDLTFRPEPPPLGLEKDPAPPRPLGDWEVQTELLAEKMGKTLTGIYRENNTMLGDQGTQVLYTALGFLEWYEDTSSKALRSAPLILVPVGLLRGNVSSGYTLRYTGDDVMGNEPLALRLRQDFGVELPRLDPETLDVAAYLHAVAGVVATQPGWKVQQNAVHLGFFSFSRYLMARDLDADAWPAGQGPEHNEVIQALLGEEGFARSTGKDGYDPPPDEGPIDTFLPPSKTVHVVDADSSQALSIYAASRGQHLLIQGPPGTGKSQTITNIIADAVAQGRTVLFVAEKMAALEVVGRRLSQVELGTAVLELHGHQTTRKAFVGQLKVSQAALQVSAGAGPKVDTQARVDTQALDGTAAQLNAYVDALHLPLQAYGVTPFEALGQWARLGELQAPALSLPEAASWDRAALERREAVAQLMQAWVKQRGSPDQHPFWGMSARSLTPMDLGRVRSALSTGLEALSQAGQLSGALGTALGRDLGSSVSQLGDAADATLHLAKAPDLSHIDLTAPAWTEQREALIRGLDQASQLTTLRSHHEASILPEAWTTPVGAWKRDLGSLSGKWWRGLSGPYRAARQGAVGLLRERGRPDDTALLALLSDLETASDVQQRLGSLTPVLTSVFGERWQGRITATESLREVVAWVGELRDRASAQNWPRWATEDAQTLIAAAQSAQVQARDLREQLGRAESHLAQASTLLGFKDSSPGLSISATEARWRSRRDLIDRAQEMATFNSYATEAQSLGIGALLALTFTWDQAGQHLTDALRQVWLDTVIRTARQERPVLANFDAARHEQLIERFRQLDQGRLRENRSLTANAHKKRVNPSLHPQQWRILTHQFNLKQRFKAIRALMTEAGSAIQQLTPVFMMSPLSVASYLPRGELKFDLVIFDEASQIRPEDGLGAIARGQQVIVVGDEQQLPPSDFFASQDGGLNVGGQGMVADLESLLGSFQAASAPQTMLRWHYRSRHESLIAVSNQEFYDNGLVLFPSPDAGRTRLGLISHYLPDAVYDAGASRTNRTEARAVAVSVMHHARTTPGESLGVAAFSAAQADAILDELELLRRQDSATEAFFETGRHEPFFVKNLENVQGDERDVIFISVGYGKQASGKLSMNFGPLNKAGGERRMNVLITRAKRRCEVFTNLRADDLDLTRANSQGVRVLKTFLQYAATGRLDVTTENPDAEADSPFEEAVERALRARGHHIRRQIGSGGFRIDLAVVDPDAPGRYLLGIECDGATYHRLRSARDRDRLRQAVLENLGWRIHRIWSTDWFTNPGRCIQDLEQAIGAVRNPSSPSV
ncbi:DUF4011 domain-containing protein [Deinococcus sp.]|uniref:DUF4011 domain-containing protein n=1 Tax=Deinococcus sp. TaxID=47478 RepID=UPI0025FFEE25|nr:DUF4011 domain-containing protein [Deinococcus sp.]